MSEKQLPDVYEEETTEKEQLNIGTTLKKVAKKLMEKPKRTLYWLIVIMLAVSLGNAMVQNKIADRKLERMEEKLDDLQSKLEAAQEKRYERVEVKTIQKAKELLASSNLTTYTYLYENETTESSTRIMPIFGWDIPGTKNSVTIEYTGVINVGYDVEKIEIEVDKEKPVIYVTLPEPHVADNYIRFDELVCKCNNNILNPIKTDAVLEYFNTIEQEELVKAEKDGIYGKAEDQVKVIIESFFSSFPNYKIKYQ